jgi:hypothetical protein
MRSGGGVTGFGWLLIALLAATARADSPCEKGFRDTTSEERASMTRVLEGAKAALPAAPEGWVIGGYEVVSVLTRICMDGEATPWEYNVSRLYNRTDNAAEREQALADAGSALRADLAAKQPRMDALMARSQELGAELGAAAQRRDEARIAAIHAEMEQLSKQYAELANEGDAQARAQSVVAATMHDVEMSIAVSVNPGAVSTEEMQPSAAPAGAQQAFRGQTTADGFTRGRALVLVGSWRARAAGGVELVPRAGASPAAAHGISLAVSADPARIDALLSGIDFGAVEALLR